MKVHWMRCFQCALDPYIICIQIYEVQKVACKCSECVFYNAPFWMHGQCQNNACIAFTKSWIVGREKYVFLNSYVNHFKFSRSKNLTETMYVIIFRNNFFSLWNKNSIQSKILFGCDTIETGHIYFFKPINRQGLLKQHKIRYHNFSPLFSVW